MGHGSVTVETADGLTEATVRLDAGRNGAEILDETVVELRDGRALIVVAPRQGGVFELGFLGKRGGRRLDVHVTVPTGTDVSISTFTAPIRILGDVGSADLSFGAGEAAVRHVGKDLRLRYGAGTAKAVQVDGSVQLRSGAGNAEFGEIGGALTSGCGSGNVSVRRVLGPVRVRTGSGTARLAEIHGDVDATTGSGEVQIGLPEGLTAQIDLQTGSGHVHTDMPVDDAPRSRQQAVRVKARSGSGDVRLFRTA
jgi:hypothetical protein